MKKRTARAVLRAKKKAEKRQGIANPSGESRYGRKHKEQMRGHYRPTSPFYQGHDVIVVPADAD